MLLQRKPWPQYHGVRDALSKFLAELLCQEGSCFILTIGKGTATTVGRQLCSAIRIDARRHLTWN